MKITWVIFANASMAKIYTVKQKDIVESSEQELKENVLALSKNK